MRPPNTLKVPLGTTFPSRATTVLTADQGRWSRRAGEAARLKGGVNYQPVPDAKFFNDFSRARARARAQGLVSSPWWATLHRMALAVAEGVVLLANFGKEGRPEPIIAKISQETLAEMIGTTRSRVSFFLNKFRELGLVDYNGHIKVHSSLLNVVLHDQPQIKT